MSNILRSVGDGDLVSGAEKTMSVCQSAMSIQSSDNKILEHVHQFKIPVMTQAETLSLWNNCLLSRYKMYLLGSYIQQHVPVLAELILDYSTIAILLKTKQLKVLVYEMITNRCQESYESQSMTDRKNTKREHNRNKQCVENFIMFMKDFPIKPDSVLKLRQ